MPLVSQYIDVALNNYFKSIMDSMKKMIQVGISSTVNIQIDITKTISFMGKGLNVYATPIIVSDIEYACRDLLLTQLPANQDSVGTFVKIEHIAAGLLNSEVKINVKISKLIGRKVLFAATVKDKIEIIAKGQHTRFVVDKNIMKNRLHTKIKKYKNLA